jgi:hypothetical protein
VADRLHDYRSDRRETRRAFVLYRIDNGFRRLNGLDETRQPYIAAGVDAIREDNDWDSARPYRGTVRNFLLYLGDNHPAVTSLDQLRRDSHILGGFTHLRTQTPPLACLVSLIKVRPPG